MIPTARPGAPSPQPGSVPAEYAAAPTPSMPLVPPQAPTAPEPVSSVPPVPAAVEALPLAPSVGYPAPAPAPAPVPVEAAPLPVAAPALPVAPPAPAPVPAPVVPVQALPVEAAPPAPVSAPVAAPVMEPAEASPFGGSEATAPVPDGLSAKVVEMAEALLALIGDDESSEVIINGPNEIMCKVGGQRYHESHIKFETAEVYHRVLNDYLLPFCETRDRIDGVNVLVEAQMELPAKDPGVPPMLARVHVLCPPLVPFAKVTIAKKARYEFDLDGIAKNGSMTTAMSEFLKACARGRLTTVVSGPTGAGKTTLLQAMTRSYDPTDRIVVIEDTPELRLSLADTVYLCSTSMKPGVKAEDVVSTEWLVKAANRMRMDRIIVGECRGAEMAEWLIAANSGAEGSATTVHADNPRRALDKILGLATKSPTSGSEATLRREIAATVDIVVQAGLIDGRHVITHIEEVSTTVRQDAGIIATQTLFEFNRTKGVHEAKSRPSDDLSGLLRSRGVDLDAAWFRPGLS